MASNCVVVFLLPVGVCIDVYFILAYVMICSYVSYMSTHYIFATVYKHCHLGNVGIDEPLHVAVGLQLLLMSSITTLNQTILNVCTRYIFQSSFFRKNIDDFTDLG